MVTACPGCSADTNEALVSTPAMALSEAQVLKPRAFAQERVMHQRTPPGACAGD